jgi:hypothetical protein
MPIETVNYLYLGSSIVILIITYCCLCGTKKYLKNKIIQRKKIEDGVVVQTSKGNIVMDPNIFELHLKRMKKNLTVLYKDGNFDCKLVKDHLDKINIDTKRDISLNYDNIDNNYCSSSKLLNNNLIKERELMRKKLINKTGNSESDKSRHDFLELMIDIDIILFLIRSSLCKKGNLNLSAVDNLILELYRNNCVSENMTKTTSNPKEDMSLQTNYADIAESFKFGHVKEKMINTRVGNSWNTDNSQTITDDASISYQRYNNMSDYRINASKSLVQDNFLSSAENTPAKNKWITSNGITASYTDLYTRDVGHIENNTKSSILG